MTQPTISVVIPTYRRPDALAVCLRSLAVQTFAPLEVLVAFRVGDELTEGAIADLPPPARERVKRVVIGADGNLTAGLRAAIAASKGEIIALTDDDSEPPPEWLERLAATLGADANLGGVGGRDIQPMDRPAHATVGKVQWFGRMVGNHHIGIGAPREVDFLKGVNCAYRGELLRSIGIDPRLVGVGNVVHWELAICLPLRRAGWRLVYDPAITVAHHLAPRMDGDDNHRGQGFNAAALRDLAFNESLMVQEHLPPIGRIAHAAWATAIGTRFTPGVVQLGRLIAQRPAAFGSHLRRYAATQAGLLQGLRSSYSRSASPSQFVPAPNHGGAQP